MFRGPNEGKKVLTAKWNEYSQQIHKKKLQNMRGLVDTSCPITYGSLKHKPKKDQILEDRFTEIERENRILLEKMSQIVNSRSHHSSSANRRKSLNAEARLRQTNQIIVENQALLKRLQEKQPSYSVYRWEEDRRSTEKRLKNICEFPYTLGFEETPRKVDIRTRNSSRSRKIIRIPDKNANPRKLSPISKRKPFTVFKKGMSVGDKHFIVEIQKKDGLLTVLAFDIESPESFCLELSTEEALELMGGVEDYKSLAGMLGLEDGELILIDNRQEGVDEKGANQRAEIKKSGNLRKAEKSEVEKREKREKSEQELGDEEYEKEKSEKSQESSRVFGQKHASSGVQVAGRNMELEDSYREDSEKEDQDENEDRKSEESGSDKEDNDERQSKNVESSDKEDSQIKKMEESSSHEENPQIENLEESSDEKESKIEKIEKSSNEGNNKVEDESSSGQEDRHGDIEKIEESSSDQEDRHGDIEKIEESSSDHENRHGDNKKIEESSSDQEDRHENIEKIEESSSDHENRPDFAKISEPSSDKEGKIVSSKVEKSISDKEENEIREIEEPNYNQEIESDNKSKHSEKPNSSKEDQIEARSEKEEKSGSDNESRHSEKSNNSRKNQNLGGRNKRQKLSSDNESDHQVNEIEKISSEKSLEKNDLGDIQPELNNKTVIETYTNKEQDNFYNKSDSNEIEPPEKEGFSDLNRDLEPDQRSDKDSQPKNISGSESEKIQDKDAISKSSSKESLEKPEIHKIEISRSSSDSNKKSVEEKEHDSSLKIRENSSHYLQEENFLEGEKELDLEKQSRKTAERKLSSKYEAKFDIQLGFMDNLTHHDKNSEKEIKFESPTIQERPEDNEAEIEEGLDNSDQLVSKIDNFMAENLEETENIEQGLNEDEKYIENINNEALENDEMVNSTEKNEDLGDGEIENIQSSEHSEHEENKDATEKLIEGEDLNHSSDKESAHSNEVGNNEVFKENSSEEKIEINNEISENLADVNDIKKDSIEHSLKSVHNESGKIEDFSKENEVNKDQEES